MHAQHNDRIAPSISHVSQITKIDHKSATKGKKTDCAGFHGNVATELYFAPEILVYNFVMNCG